MYGTVTAGLFYADCCLDPFLEVISRRRWGSILDVIEERRAWSRSETVRRRDAADAG